MEELDGSPEGSGDGAGVSMFKGPEAGSWLGHEGTTVKPAASEKGGGAEREQSRDCTEPRLPGRGFTFTLREK